MLTDRIDFLGVRFHRLSVDEVLARLARVGEGSPYGYLVTPNVDHIVRLSQISERSKLLPAYLDADLCVCDSRVLRQIGRLHGLDLPVVPGSDLTDRLFRDVIRPGDRIAIVGGDEGLMTELAARFPRVEFVHYEPPMGLRQNPAAIEKTANFIATSNARFTMIAVGSPQQEMIAAAVRDTDATGMALCIGASLDFITGRQRRAPRWMQRLNLEWAYRLLTEPRRMWRRYLVEGPRIFLLAARYRRNGSAR